MIGISSPPCYQKPSGGMYLSSDQLNLVNMTWTKVLLDGVLNLRAYSDGIEDVGNNRILPGVAGLYWVHGQVTFINMVVNRDYKTAISRSGAQLLYGCGHATTTPMLTVPASGLIPLAADEYVELEAWSNSGDNTVDIEGLFSVTFLHVQRVR